jgi:hypothetical protein
MTHFFLRPYCHCQVSWALWTLIGRWWVELQRSAWVRWPKKVWRVSTRGLTLQGGFLSHVGTPIAGWFISWKIEKINGWFGGTPFSATSGYILSTYVYYILYIYRHTYIYIHMYICRKIMTAKKKITASFTPTHLSGSWPTSDTSKTVGIKENTKQT